MNRDPLTYEAYTSTFSTGTYLNKDIWHQYGTYVSTYMYVNHDVWHGKYLYR